MHEELIKAIKSGDLERVKYLLNPEIFALDIHDNEDDALIIAYRYKKYEIAKYLLTSPDLKEHADIHARREWLLITAVERNDLDWIRFSLTSPDLKNKAHLRARKNFVFQRACQVSHVSIVEYLLTSPELKEHSQYSSNGHQGFCNALKGKNKAVIHFLAAFYSIGGLTKLMADLHYMPEIKQLEPLLESKQLKVLNNQPLKNIKIL